MHAECTTASPKRCALCMCLRVHLSLAASDMMRRSIAGAAFEDLLQQQPSGGLVQLCDYCHTFVHEFSSLNRRGGGRWRSARGRKWHPLHLVVDYILSGACSTPAPSRLQFVRWISEMDAEHPILCCTRHGEFRDRLQAISSFDPLFGAGSISLARWLFEGGSHIFDDMDLGRNIRRLISSGGAPRFWETLPSACRRCAATENNNDFLLGYSGALLHGSAQRMMAEFEGVIEVAPAIAGLTVFCLRCRAVSAISFEYDSALRAALRIAPQTREGHYARIATLHSLQRGGVPQ